MKRPSLRQSSSIVINNPKHTNISSCVKTNQLISSGQKNLFNQPERKQSYLAASKTSRASICPNESLVGQSIQMHLLLKKSLQQSSSSQCATTTTTKDKSEQLTAHNNSIVGSHPALKNTAQIPQPPLAQLFSTVLGSSKKSLREMYTSSQFEEKIKEDLQREISKLLDKKKEDNVRANKKDSKRYAGSQDTRNENGQGSHSISSLGFITIDDNQANIDVQRNNRNEYSACQFIGGVYLKDRKSREGIMKGQKFVEADSSSKELLRDSNNSSVLHSSEQHPAASELIDMMQLHANNNSRRTTHKQMQKYEYPPNVVTTSQQHKNPQRMSNNRKQSLPAVILKENAKPLKKKRNKFKVLADYIRDTLPRDGAHLFQHNSLAGIAVENSRCCLLNAQTQGQLQQQDKRLNELIKGEDSGQRKSDLAGDELSDDAIIEDMRKACQYCQCNGYGPAGDFMESSKIIIGGKSNHSCKRQQQFRSANVSHRNDADVNADDDLPSKSFHERMFRASKRDLLMRDYLLSDRRLYQPGEVIVTHTKSLDTTIYSVMEQQDESMHAGGGEEWFKQEQYGEEEDNVGQKQKQDGQVGKSQAQDAAIALKLFETRGQYRRLSENLRSGSSSSSLLKMMPSQRDDCWMGKIKSSAMRKSNYQYQDNHGKEEQQYLERKLLEQQIEMSNHNDNQQLCNQQVTKDDTRDRNNKFGMHERGRARRSIELKSTFTQDQVVNLQQKSAALPIIAGPSSREHPIVAAVAEKPRKHSHHGGITAVAAGMTTTTILASSASKPRRIIIPFEQRQHQSSRSNEYQQKMEYSKILQRRARSNADGKLNEYAGWEHVKGEIWPDER